MLATQRMYRTTSKCLKRLSSTAGLLLPGFLLAPAAHAQAEPVQVSGPQVPAPQQDCEHWKELGLLHQDSEAPIWREWRFFGRLHAQYGYVQGGGSGERVHYDGNEVRRLWFGSSVLLAPAWKVLLEANLLTDTRASGGEMEFEFNQMRQVIVTYAVDKAYPDSQLSPFTIGYGNRVVQVSREWSDSSKRIKTIERSAIANHIHPKNSDGANPTGVWAEGEAGFGDWELGIFATDQDEWLADWNDGELYYGRLEVPLQADTPSGDTRLRWGGYSQNTQGDEEVLAGGIDWATSLALQYEQGPWELFVEGIAGDNGRQSQASRSGEFWGAVVMASYWLEPGRLEAVGRVQYQNAEQPEGIRLNSRYVRLAGNREGISQFSNGRGDEHISVYAGINKLLCGYHHQWMLGVEYDDLDRDGSSVFHGTTVMVSYKLYF